MRILAIDTATTICGVALTESNKLVAEYRLNRRNVHNEALVLMIQQLLQAAEIDIADVDAVAVSEGPGSFTGLRIGFAVAKGLVFSSAHKFVTVNSLDAIAYNVKYWPQEVCVVSKARESECYLARYRVNPDFERISDYQIVQTAALSDFIRPSTLFLVNPATLASEIQAAGGVIAPTDLVQSRAANLARLAGKKLLAGQTVDPGKAQPFYLKDFKPKKKQPSPG